MLQRLGLLSAAALVLLPASCNYGPQRIPETGATLEGTVTYGKDKVLVAMIIAQGTGAPATGFIEDDGRYQLKNVPLGEVNIAVNVKAAEGQLMSKRMAKQAVPNVIHVPDKYGDPNTSGIKTTISKGQNTFDIVIPK
jgi:hypothetical protein